MFPTTIKPSRAALIVCLALSGCATSTGTGVVEEEKDDDTPGNPWIEHDLRSCRVGVYKACKNIATTFDPPDPDETAGYGSAVGRFGSMSAEVIGLGGEPPEYTPEQLQTVAWSAQMLWLLETRRCEPDTDCDHSDAAIEPDDLARLEEGLREARRAAHAECTGPSDGLTCIALAEADGLLASAETFSHPTHYWIHACRLGRSPSCEEVLDDVSGTWRRTGDAQAHRAIISARKKPPRKPPGKPSAKRGKPSKSVFDDSELGNLFGGNEGDFGDWGAGMTGLMVGLDPEDVKACKKNDRVACYEAAATDLSSMALFDDDDVAKVEAAKEQQEDCKARAVKLYTARCDKDDATACHHMGLMHRYRLMGLGGFSKGIELMDKACELGLGEGCVELGRVPRLDPERALDAFKRACELTLQSNPRLGCAEAAAWLAVAGRHEEAQSFLELDGSERVRRSVRYWK